VISKLPMYLCQRQARVHRENPEKLLETRRAGKGCGDLIFASLILALDA